MNDNELIYSKVEFANMANELKRLFDNAIENVKTDLIAHTDLRLKDVNHVYDNVNEYGHKLSDTFNKYLGDIREDLKNQREYQDKVLEQHTKSTKILAVATLLAGQSNLTTDMALLTIERIEEKLAERSDNRYGDRYY